MGHQLSLETLEPFTIMPKLKIILIFKFLLNMNAFLVMKNPFFFKMCLNNFTKQSIVSYR